jgi:hypothetical protein
MSVEVEILKGVSKGKRKQINPIHAKSLAAVGFLRIVDGADEESEPVRTKRVYRRKDMVAEA